jgi:hypothetical protein
MALIVITENHEALIQRIERAIDADVAIDWSYGTGRDYIYNGRLGNQARLRHTVEGDAVIFGVVPAPGVPLTPASYGRIHSAFAEILLAFAEDVLDSVEITATVTEYDQEG